LDTHTLPLKARPHTHIHTLTLACRQGWLTPDSCRPDNESIKHLDTHTLPLKARPHTHIHTLTLACRQGWLTPDSTSTTEILSIIFSTFCERLRYNSSP